MLECDAIQKLHHDERLAILLVDFMNGADVGMVQSRSGLCFTAKAAQDLSIFGHFVGQKLQRNKAIEFGVLGFVYDAHPAAAQLLEDAIVRDGLADHIWPIMGDARAGAFILRTGLRLVNVFAVLGEARRAVHVRLTSNPETVPGQKS